MDISRYFKSIEGLPDPKGSLSSSLHSRAIAQALKELWDKKKKRGPYNIYSPGEQAKIGKYASIHGATAAPRFFSRKLAKNVSKSTVDSIHKVYIEEVKRKRQEKDGGDHVKTLLMKNRGRPVLLGNYLDSKVQLYLKKVREGGGAVSTRIAMAAAKGIVLQYENAVSWIWWPCTP